MKQAKNRMNQANGWKGRHIETDHFLWHIRTTTEKQFQYYFNPLRSVLKAYFYLRSYLYLRLRNLYSKIKYNDPVLVT